MTYDVYIKVYIALNRRTLDGNLVDGEIIYVDIERCVGCLSCYIACAVEHSLTKSLHTAIYETPRPLPRIKVAPALGYNVPIRCMHCEKPPCVEVCPTGALVKAPKGPVLIKREACIGCKGCILACPYGAVTLSTAEKIASKCDFCFERTEKGLPPACVEACPTKALKYGRVEDVLREVHERKAREFVAGLTGAPGGTIVLYGKPSVR
ncbi:MAG: 4Fe-4S dicluster domain-containing protein [Sulfolobales archaeon]